MIRLMRKLNIIHKHRPIVILIKCVLSFFLIQINISKVEAREKKYDLPYPEIILELAKSIDMEPVGGREFLYNLKKNNGQGAPYIFSQASEIKVGVTYVILFWCQKKNHEKKKYLVYAVKEPKKDNEEYSYTIKDIISPSELFDHNYDNQFSYGIVEYDGVLGITKDLSYFSYLNDSNEHGPPNIYPIRLSGFLPIIIHQKNFAIVLYRYQGRWLKYIKNYIKLIQIFSQTRNEIFFYCTWYCIFSCVCN